MWGEGGGEWSKQKPLSEAGGRAEWSKIVRGGQEEGERRGDAGRRGGGRGGVRAGKITQACGTVRRHVKHLQPKGRCVALVAPPSHTLPS